MTLIEVIVIKTGKVIALEYTENDDRKLEHSFNLFVTLNINTNKLNPLHYISLPEYSFDCFLKLIKVELDTIQDEQLVKNFISAIRCGICGFVGDLYVIMITSQHGILAPVTYAVMHYA